MASEATAPVLIQPIPPQIVNEGAVYGPFNLREYIQSVNEESGSVHFTAELADGNALPKGLICTSDGIITGIPASGTQGNYQFVIIAENDSKIPLTERFDFTIKERITLDSPEIINNLKSRVWEALGQNLPIPEMEDIFNRPFTAAEIYYLLQRFATLTIWDVYNLEVPGEKILLNLPGASQHYNIYDRGSCLIAAPKDLYSYERTLEDALQTARALAREVYNRGWVIEFAGFNKMVRAAWIELQNLSEQYGKEIEILRFTPSAEDIQTYKVQSKGKRPSL